MIDLHVNDVSLGKLVIENIHRISIFISYSQIQLQNFCQWSSCFSNKLKTCWFNEIRCFFGK